MTLRVKHVAQAAQGVFAVLGILALGYCATGYVRAKFFQASEERRFTNELRTPRGDGTVPRVEPASKAMELNPAEGSVVGMLAIPRLGISTVVIEGVSAADLALAPGHIPGTSLPGGPGNVAIAGHRDTSFRALRQVRKDDAITLVTRRGKYSYRVVSTQIVSPDDIRVLYPTSKEALTLVTCYPFSFVGHAPRRFIVRAERLAGS